MELWNEILFNTNIMDKAIKELKERGQAFAKAEHDYKVASAQKILSLRAEGVPVTIISDLVKGDREVAKLRMDRDISEVLYKSCLEGINVYKIKTRILEGQLQREWGKND